MKILLTKEDLKDIGRDFVAIVGIMLFFCVSIFVSLEVVMMQVKQ